MKDFIEKYELRSPRIKKLYPDVTLNIAHVTSAYDNVIQHVRKIIEESPVVYLSVLLIFHVFVRLSNHLGSLP
jgi:hypothetical protein